MNLAEIIKHYRKKAGMSQEALADCLSLAPSAISNYERGKRAPDLEMIRRISAVLGIPPGILITDDTQSPDHSGDVLADGGLTLNDYLSAGRYRKTELNRIYDLLSADNQDIVLGKAKELYLIQSENNAKRPSGDPDQS